MKIAEAGLAFAALLCAALPAQAELVSGVEVGLNVQHQEIELDAEGVAIDTDITRLGIAIWESAGPVMLGLEGGPLRVTQNDNPATAGMDLTGQYIAVSAGGLLYTSERLDLGLSGSLGYNRADDDRDGQDTRLRWYEGRAELKTTVKLFPVYLSGGGYAIYLDGKETASGPFSYTRDFESDGNAGGFLALDYWTDATGRISLRADAGARNGFELQFARRF